MLTYEYYELGGGRGGRALLVRFLVRLVAGSVALSIAGLLFLNTSLVLMAIAGIDLVLSHRVYKRELSRLMSLSCCLSAFLSRLNERVQRKLV